MYGTQQRKQINLVATGAATELSTTISNDIESSRSSSIRLQVLLY